jgi:hypothetical protein
MKQAIQFLAFFILPFVLFGQYTDETTAGFIKVKSGISAPSTVVRGSSFTVSFKLKETLGQSITVQELALALHKENGAYVEDLKKWTTSSYCSFGANEEKNFNFSANITSASVIEGEYKLVLKLKINNAWLDIQVLSSTAMNPKSVYVDVLAPTIVTSVSNLNFGSVEVGSSKTMTYSVSAQNLIADLKLTAPTGFQLQADGSLWNQTLTIPPSSDGSINNVTIQVRFSPTQPGPYNGLISHKSTGANTKNVNLSADGIEISSYNIQTSANPSSGGNPSGAGTYLRGSVCHLNSNTNPGWIFNGWYNLSGSLESSNSNYTFTVTDNRYLIAKFTRNYNLSLQSNGGGTGFIKVNGASHALPFNATYQSGTQVTLEAVPDQNHLFTGWGGDLTGVSNPTTLTMTSDKVVNVGFSAPLPDYTLNISNTGDGNGLIKVNGASHALPFNSTFQSGSQVTLEAVPDINNLFTGWGGDLTGVSNPTTLTMTSDKFVNVGFSAPLPDYTLNISNTGDGNGSIKVNGIFYALPFNSTFQSGTQVTLEAVPDQNHLFTGWGGDLTGVSNPTTITMTSDKVVNVGFSAPLPDYTLNISNTGDGNGSIKVNGIFYTLPFNSTFQSGTQVTLEAVPDLNNLFIGWSGDLTGSSNPITLTMTSDKVVNIGFSAPLQEYHIYLSKTGDGDGIVLLNGSMIPVLPCTLSVTATETVTFFALPDASSLFSGWQGDLTGTINPISFTIASNMTIIVGFASTVPVELISNSVTAVKNNVNINWSTATETNASHFIIERKLSDGEWFETGNVRAAGTSTTKKNYEFVDKNVAAGKYFYRLKQVDFDGRFQIFDAFDIEVVTPVTIKLDQNYPNPFNPSTRIDFSIPVSANVTLDIFDISGQKVATVISGQMNAGYHFVDFDAAKYGLPIRYLCLQTLCRQIYLNQEDDTFKIGINSQVLFS